MVPAMNIQANLHEQHLRASLLQRLRPLMARRSGGMHVHGEQLFSYCALDRERIAAAQLPDPVIGIVLRGTKEVWLGDTGHVFPPGSVFVLPGGVPLDVVNIPGDESGAYESLLFAVPELPPGVERPPVRKAPQAGMRREFGVPLTPDLVEAFSHAATIIADGASSQAIKKLRLAEVLTLLRPVPAASVLFHLGLAEEVALMIAGAPAQDWTVPRVATRLRLGESTLRRRLKAENRTFRGILREERLRAARAALAAGASSLAAAEAAGYASRSHFSRRYREAFGTSPGGRS